MRKCVRKCVSLSRRTGRVPRSSFLEGRVLCRCHPHLGIGNQGKKPPLKSVKDGVPKHQNLSKSGPPAICPLLKLRTSRERFYIGQPLFGEYKANKVYYSIEMNEGRKRVLVDRRDDLSCSQACPIRALMSRSRVSDRRRHLDERTNHGKDSCEIPRGNKGQ